MSSTFHIGFGDANISFIRVYPNGTSGGYYDYSYSSYTNGFYYTATSPTQVAFRAYTSGSGTGTYWLWYNITGNNNGTDSTYTTSGYQDGKNYVLIAHKTGVTGSLTFVTACDNTYPPYKMGTTTPSRTFYFSSSDVYSGATMPYGLFSSSTAFTIYIRTGSSEETGGSMAGRNLTGSNNITISGTTDSGYNASKDYVIKCFGQQGTLTVTITPAKDLGFTNAYVNGYTTAQTVVMGSSVSLYATLKSPTYNYTELTTQVQQEIYTWSFSYWDVGGSYYLTQSATHTATTTATATAYSTSSTSYAYAWRLSFSANGGGGTMTPILGAYTSTGSSTITVPTCTYTPPTSDTRFKCWTDGTNNYNVGDTITRSTHLTIYPVWVYIVPSFSWTNDDDTKIATGQPTTNLKATSWNTMANDIYACETLQGKSHSYVSTVNAGDQILASDFNSARNAMGLLNGYSSIPTIVSIGDSLVASKFAGNTSLKTTLNQIITYTNNL